MANELQVVTIGLDDFTPALRERDVPCLNVLWKPPAQGDPELTDILFRLTVFDRDADGRSRINAANRKALAAVLASRPVLRRVVRAGDALPGLRDRMLLHAGPPLRTVEACGPMRGAMVGAVLYEGWAATEPEAEALLDSGRVTVSPTYGHGVAAPMAGVVSPSMPLFQVENTTTGGVAYSPINEGIGHVLRFGANNPPVIKRLAWIEEILAPAMDRAVTALGGISLGDIIAQAVLMGDELHQRNVAASLFFHKRIAAALAEQADSDHLADIVRFLAGNEQFFLNLAMAAARVCMDSARNIPHSSLVTSMSRNGTDFGLTVSALGDTWLTAPSLLPRGLYFPGYSEDDANPDMGDSAIMECYGLGGFAMAAAPLVARFLGAGDLREALQFSLDMAHITVGTNPDYPIPTLDFSGTPTGIDLLKVVATGIAPVINSGVAHKRAGMGQVGAGLTTPPMELMTKALRLFHSKELGQT
ncbi:MAG: DUF1116 domain-containing protein [Planctomycetes bacterium]|nr:DUF1116 domain-containing protein [Planctomycetota bacterium]